MDTVDRKRTIKHLKKRLIETAINNTGVKALCDSIFADIADNRIEAWVNEVPSVRPKGKWILVDNRIRPYMCSYCKRLFDVDTSMGDPMWNYCPNCGAEMEESND